jgi:hypothetical protein
MSSSSLEEPAASESLKVLKSKVAEKELPQALPLRSTFDVRSAWKPKLAKSR